MIVILIVIENVYENDHDHDHQNVDKCMLTLLKKHKWPLILTTAVAIFILLVFLFFRSLERNLVSPAPS